MVLLEVRGLTKTQSGVGVVQDVSFTQQLFQKMAIAGEAGSGKSTLLKMIGGHLQADGGEAFLLKEKIKGPDEVLIPGHKKIGYLSQHFELRNNYKVYEVIDMASKVGAETVAELCNICRVGHLLQRWTDELSGGEKQRIALARLLVAEPTLLLLDEPFSNLDAGNKKIMQDVLHDLSTSAKTTCLMVSHDSADILSWADEVIIMRNGKIVQQDTAHTVYFKPKDLYCATLFGEVNYITEQSVFFEKALQRTNFFIRPQHLVAGPATEDGVTARVSRKLFRGNGYQLEVTVAEEVFTLQLPTDDFPVGSEVSLSLHPAYFNIS